MANADRINQLLKQMQHHDSDERYMATSDLITELAQIEALIESALQLPIRNAILRQLNDKSIDVQAVAVKCLSLCVQKFHTDQVVDIVDKLGQLITDPQQKQESRDIYSIGLKTMISSVRDEDGELFATKLAKSLVTGLRLGQSPALRDDAYEITCLDVTKELLVRFGHELQTLHDELIRVLLPLLENSSDSIRKRASLTLGILVRDVSDALFQVLMESVIAKIESSLTKSDFLYTYIQTVGVVSRHAGVRVGKYLHKIIPTLEQFCKIDAVEDMKDTNEKRLELWENCLQAFESVIQRCPNEVTPYIQGLVRICFDFARYDPNYSYEEEVDQTEDGGWGDDQDEDNVFEDDAANADDDSSWKVRRAAIKTLDAFIRARSDMLKQYYNELLTSLVSRFKERDDNVKIEIFTALRDLLREAVVGTSTRLWRFLELDDHKFLLAASIPPLQRQRSSFETLTRKVDDIIMACDLQLKSGNMATKRAVLAVIRQLVLVLGGGLDRHLNMLIPHLVDGIRSKDSTLKAESLSLLFLIIHFHSCKSFLLHVKDIVEVAILAVGELYAKIKAEALRVCAAIAESIKNESNLVESYGQALFDVTYKVLSQRDLDQEVKDASIGTMSIILAVFGSRIRGTRESLPIFVERMENEVTRIAALRAITRIANSPLHIDLTSILGPTMEILCKFLRQNSQPLRQEALRTLEALVRTNGSNISLETFRQLLRETAPLISDTDLHLSHLVLDLIRSIVLVQPSVTDVIVQTLERILFFLKSPLLQRAALDSLISLFQVLVGIQSSAISFSSLLQALLNCVSPELPRQSVAAIAQCIAAMTRGVDSATLQETIRKFILDVQTESTPSYRIQLSLLVLGEIGRSHDMSSHGGVENVIFSALFSKQDEIQAAAAFALGNVAVGNLTKYVPFVSLSTAIRSLCRKKIPSKTD